MKLNRSLLPFKNEPATDRDISNSEKAICGCIPDIYKAFLKITNGLNLDACILYSTEEIVDFYRIHEIATYAPDYLCIGSDNGDGELIMKAEKSAVLCGFVDAGSIGTAEPDAWFDFEKWVENGCEMPTEDNDDMPELGSVSVVRLPEEKTKFLVEMRKVFTLSDPMNNLLAKMRTIPCVICSGITEGKAMQLIGQTHYKECYRFSYHQK